MKVNIEKQPKSTVKINVVVPAQKVKEAYEEILNEVVKETEISGFRKGHAPRDKVLEKTDVSKLYGEVVNTLLQKYYPQALKENLITPIANPRVEIQHFDLEKDFEFNAIVAIRPEIKVGDFKKELKENFEKKQAKQKELNAEKLKNGEQIESEHVHLNSNDLLEVIVKNTQVEIADMLIEEEVERMMARLVDQSQAIGLSLESYLKAQNKTQDDLRKDYAQIAEKNLKSEFALSYLVSESKIEVTDQEIEKLFVESGAENVEEKMKNPMEKWYVKSILEKNKYLTGLAEEVEGHKHE